MPEIKKVEEKLVSSYIHIIDYPAVELMMKYFRFEDYDSMAKYAQKFGLKIDLQTPDPRLNFYLSFDNI